MSTHGCYAGSIQSSMTNWKARQKFSELSYLGIPCDFERYNPRNTAWIFNGQIRGLFTAEKLLKHFSLPKNAKENEQTSQTFKDPYYLREFSLVIIFRHLENFQ